MIFTLRESAAIRLDKFDVVGDHLDGAAFDPFIRFPLGIIQDTGNSDFCPTV